MLRDCRTAPSIARWTHSLRPQPNLLRVADTAVAIYFRQHFSLNPRGGKWLAEAEGAWPGHACHDQGGIFFQWQMRLLAMESTSSVLT